MNLLDVFGVIIGTGNAIQIVEFSENMTLNDPSYNCIQILLTIVPKLQNTFTHMLNYHIQTFYFVKSNIIYNRMLFLPMSQTQTMQARNDWNSQKITQTVYAIYETMIKESIYLRSMPQKGVTLHCVYNIMFFFAFFSHSILVCL